MDNPDRTKEAGVSEFESETEDTAKSTKKKFVSPEISAPVDVLEATTFFQTTTSGTTN